MARKKSFKPAYENFPVSKFKGISFRFEDDVYECAWLLLRLDDAKGNGTNTIHRHTVYGLAREFASLADIPEAHVLVEFERWELPCEPAWNSMTNPCPQSVYHLEPGMELKARRKQSKVAPFAHNHDRACLMPAIIWLARAVNVVRPFSLSPPH